MRKNSVIVYGKPVYATHMAAEGERSVRVMAIADGYAMVRRKGCIPYVVSLSDVNFNEKHTP